MRDAGDYYREKEDAARKLWEEIQEHKKLLERGPGWALKLKQLERRLESARYVGD